MSVPTELVEILEKLRRVSDEAHAAEEVRNRAVRERNMLILEARRARATWPEVREATGISQTAAEYGYNRAVKLEREAQGS